ncbi:MAG: Hsp70 family protein [Hyphomonadaceae bacterium]|nr:Hsp70 family protein [Hyphomonadaceae bacterium]
MRDIIPGIAAQNDAAPRICLDFGTSFSKASVFLGSAAQTKRAPVIPLRLGAVSGAQQPYLTPSIVFLDPERAYCGPNAQLRAETSVRSKRDPILSFKMLLSAQDIEGTLALKLGPSVDPTRSFTHRQALILYLAHLDQLIGAAIISDPAVPDDLARAPLRLTSPLWRAEAHSQQSLGRLFDEAEHVSAQLGDALNAQAGVSLDDLRWALHAAAQAPARGRFAGVQQELESAAAAYASFSKSKSDYVLVMDVGAGTTDIAGYRVERRDGQITLHRVRKTRQCCDLAGDQIDTILIHQMLRRSRAGAAEEKAAVWRALRLAARDLKAELLTTGKCTLRVGKRAIVVRKEALLSDSSFKQFARSLSRTLAQSLEAVALDALKHGGAISICLAGGGANMGFLDTLAEETAKKWRSRVKLVIERFDYHGLLHDDAWLQEKAFAAAFPQLVISMGGAAAPFDPPNASAWAAA